MDIYYLYYGFIITLFLKYIFDTDNNYIILKKKENKGCENCTNFNFLDE